MIRTLGTDCDGMRLPVLLRPMTSSNKPFCSRKSYTMKVKFPAEDSDPREKGGGGV